LRRRLRISSAEATWLSAKLSGPVEPPSNWNGPSHRPVKPGSGVEGMRRLTGLGIRYSPLRARWTVSAAAAPRHKPLDRVPNFSPRRTERDGMEQIDLRGPGQRPRLRAGAGEPGEPGQTPPPATTPEPTKKPVSDLSGGLSGVVHHPGSMAETTTETEPGKPSPGTELDRGTKHVKEQTDGRTGEHRLGSKICRCPHRSQS
jgi:hypothetical protein